MGSSSCRSPLLPAFAVLLLFCASLSAQTPFLLKDIATVQKASVPSWPFHPGPMTEMNGIFYFRASDGVHGSELFRTDLTAAGTWMLKDICVGACNGASILPQRMLVHQGFLYFAADDAIHGLEIWRTDGTSAGTGLVADIAPGMASSYPQSFVALGPDILFRATSPALGTELWKTDGTSAGTTLVKDMNPGIMSSFATPQGLLGSVVLLSADTEDFGREYWVSDGTPAGTQILKNIADGSLGSISGAGELAPEQLLIQGTTAFFAASQGGVSPQLWKTDGTEAGTILLENTPGFPAEPLWFADHGGFVYFGAYAPSTGRELWRTDGTPAGTTLVEDMAPGSAWLAPEQLISDGTRLYFYAAAHLWASNGTPGGSAEIDLQGAFVANLRYGAVSQGKLLFEGWDNAHGHELWASEGTTATTQRVLDLTPGPASALFSGFLNSLTATPSGALFFALAPGVGWTLWHSDGSEVGTELVDDIDTQASGLRPYSSFTAARSAGRVYFGADDVDHGLEPWTSDGSSGGTMMLADTRPNPQAFESSIPFAATGSGAIFRVSTNDGLWTQDDLWTTTGSPGGTQVLFPNLSYSQLAPNGSRALFTSGPTLRSTDGTLAGTIVVADSVSTLGPEAAGGTFFSKLSGGHPSLWYSDGSAPGTHLVAEFPESLSEPLLLAGNPTRLYFYAEDSAAGFELWRSDGGSGTDLVADILPGIDSSFPSPTPDFFTNEAFGTYPAWALSKSLFFFLANDGVNGRELWRSDGTEGGTALAFDSVPGPSSTKLRWLSAVGSRAFFVSEDEASGRELWTSDGTAAGTHLVKDIVPGPESSMPQSIVDVEGKAYFAAWTPVSGLELWRSDGTEGGTQQIADINPGVGSSTPAGLTVSPPYLFFSASDGEHGFEPWALLVPALALKPSSLGVDDAQGNANGLWEPGESVKLQPVWENLATTNITAVTAIGSGTNGAQCTDAGASYGTFAPLDLRSCLSTGNCYAATVPSPRPSTHWDVTLHETLSTGKVHDWPIHIAGSFDDVAADDDGYSDIEALLHSNLAAGCSGSSFCPQDVVTRAQAARFLSLGLAGGSANLVLFTGNVPGKGAYDCTDGGTSVFADVGPDDPFCRFVHDLAAREITAGCSADAYCPTDSLSRAQLALLLGKMLAQGTIPTAFSSAGGAYDCSPATPSIHFLDVDETHPFCAAAHYLWATEISRGCDATRFCPDGIVTRAQVARLLVNAFELGLQ